MEKTSAYPFIVVILCIQIMQLVIFYFRRLLQSGFSLRGRVAERRLAETLPDGEDQGNMDPEDEHSIRDALDGYY